MSIIIQSIEVEWTKQSRGAPYATYRNAVPEYVFNIFYGNALRFDASVSKTKPTVEYRDEVNLW